MLGKLVQGLFEWLFDLFISLLSAVCNSLLAVMTTDLAFFEQTVPAFNAMKEVFLAAGWALLLGNFVFQAMKAMLSGLGFEGESPGILAVRTCIFGFFLVFSRQIFGIGLTITGRVIDLVGASSSVSVNFPSGMFSGIPGGWVLMIVVGFIVGFQMIKLFFEIGERYAIVCLLTLLAPMGLAMGGSKSTHEICKGYIRMYASMLVMMLLNVMFLKMVLSALDQMPSDMFIIPWCVLVVALVKVARKADETLNRIGLNAAITGDPLRQGVGAGTMVLMMARSMAASKGAGSRFAGGRIGGTGSGRPASPPKVSSPRTGGAGYSSVNNTAQANTSNASQNNQAGYSTTTQQNAQGVNMSSANTTTAKNSAAIQGGAVKATQTGSASKSFVNNGGGKMLTTQINNTNPGVNSSSQSTNIQSSASTINPAANTGNMRFGAATAGKPQHTVKSLNNGAGKPTSANRSNNGTKKSKGAPNASASIRNMQQQQGMKKPMTTPVAKPAAAPPASVVRRHTQNPANAAKPVVPINPPVQTTTAKPPVIPTNRGGESDG